MTAKFTIGADPELFVVDRKTGAFVSAHNLVPGTKEEPHKVAGTKTIKQGDKTRELKYEGAIQRDGLALEFNTAPVPSDDFKAFEDQVLGVMSAAHENLKKGGDFTFATGKSAVKFDKSYYEGLPDSAKELGCDPDFCAYSEDIFAVNPRPAGDDGSRGAGGHLHIGWGSDIPVDNEEHMEICRGFIRNLDCFVGMGMLLIDRDDARREVYGKAGAFRPKSYGVEYRTPSNAWIWSSANRRFVHRLLTSCISDMMKGANCVAERLKRDGVDVQSIINTGDRDMASRILRDYCGVSADVSRLNVFPADTKAA